LFVQKDLVVNAENLRQLCSMNMMTRLKSTSAVAAPVDYDALTLRLRAMDRPLLQQVIEQERLRTGEPEGTPPNPAEIEAEALRLADGGEIEIPTNHPDKLHVLRAARAAVARAVGVMGERQFCSQLAFALSERQRRAAEWAALIHGTVEAILNLQRLNRKRAALAREIKGNANIALPCEFGQAQQILLGLGIENAASTHEFLRTAVDEGIVTAGEIDRLSADKGKVHR
jgi:hypothetical protein